MRSKIIACLTSPLFLAMTTTLAMAANVSKPNLNDAANQCVSSIKSAADCKNKGGYGCMQCFTEVSEAWNRARVDVAMKCFSGSYAPACGAAQYKADTCGTAVTEVKNVCNPQS